MKILTQGIAVVMVLAFLALAGPRPARAADVSFDFFYSNLSPHGNWLVSAQYGQVWQPRVYAAGWNPYYDGHWVYTDVGWAWVSDYPWGAVPYHYGTWVEDADYGWVWVPGYVWAPSWVVFRTGPDYIGWAPVSPRFTVGVSAGFGATVSAPFVFVSTGDFLAPRVRTYVVPESQTTIILNHTRVVNRIEVENNVVVNRGPDPGWVERSGGGQVRQVRIEQVQNVAPGRVSRASLRIDPQRMRGGVTAAEPVHGREGSFGEDGRPDFRREASPPPPRSSQPGDFRPHGQRSEPRKSPSRPPTQVAPQTPPAQPPDHGSTMKPNDPRKGQTGSKPQPNDSKKNKKPPKKPPKNEGSGNDRGQQ